jgi:hypothetical protein
MSTLRKRAELRMPRGQVVEKSTAAQRALMAEMATVRDLKFAVLDVVQGQPVFPSVAAMAEVMAAVLAHAARSGAELDHQVLLACAVMESLAANSYQLKLGLIEQRGTTVLSVSELVH